jgi:hypothetical protein
MEKHAMLSCTQRRSGLPSSRLAAALAATALLIPGCGDDGGGSGGPPDSGPDAYAGDGVAPTVKVTFPPPNSLTDTPMVTIRGTADDVDDIAAVRVNGAMAQSSDGFATWEATVSLVHGDNAIVVATEDEFDAVDDSAAELTVVLSANVMDSPTAVVADPANGRALVFDRQLDALVAVSYATGERTIVSDDATGEGPELQDPEAAVFDEAGNRVLVLDGAALLAVDLATGNRSVIADGTTGTGDLLAEPFDIALDAPEKNRALVLDIDGTDVANPVATLYAVALDTGDRTVLSRGVGASGPELLNPTALALDPAGNRAFIAFTDNTDGANFVRAVMAVALDTDERTVISTNANADQGRLLGDPVAMVLDDSVTPARLLVLDGNLDAILAVAVDTGNRTVVAEDRVTPGQDFSVPDALALDKAGDVTRALVVDSGLDMVIAVALGDGARTVFSGFNVGEGPLFQQPVAVVVDERAGTAGSAVVVDRQQNALLSVDFATSGRKEISGEEAGSGPDFDDPQALSLDVETGLDGQVENVGKIVVADPGAAALVTVDPVSGARVTLSGGPAGAGPAFGAPRGVAFDPGDAAASVPGRFLVVDEQLNALFAVDPASGDRAIVSDAATGTGPALGVPQAVTLELGATGRTGRALVLTENPAALIAVDLTTGNREELSGPNKGDGSILESPLSVLMELRKAPPPDDTNPDDGPDAGPNDAGPDSSPAFETTGYALVVHGGAGALLAIDLATGRRTELFANGLGKGPEIGLPHAVWLDPENDRMVIADEGLDALLVVDRESLDRVVVSR